MLAPKFFACSSTVCKVCIIYSNQLHCLSILVQCNFSETMSVRLTQVDINQNSSEKRNNKKRNKQTKKKKLLALGF